MRNCTVETTKKLKRLPAALFIYSGASACESKPWTFTSVAVGIALDLAFLGCQMVWRKDGVFSWLMFMVQLMSGIGMPLLEATILNREAFAFNQQLFILAMALLQPTASPLTATLYGIFLSKGLAFQVLTADAISALAGMALIIFVTTFEILTAGIGYMSSIGAGDATYILLVPIGALLAVGPWALVYVLLGVILVPFEIFFILGFFEMWLAKTGYCWAIAIFCLLVGVGIMSFVALTPVFAIWELGWKIRQMAREKKAKAQAPPAAAMEKGADEKGQLTPDGSMAEAQPVFPLARWFRRKMEGASRWKRAMVKIVFVLFIILSMASFVGRWMFTVSVLNYANDAYCPSGFKPAVLGGLGLKAATLGAGMGAYFAGLL